MAIKELNVNFPLTNPNAKILGRRDLLSKELEGNWATSFKGKGLEFTGYRKYTFSDDASNIDWRASLRSKSLLVREYEEFKNFNVVFVIDVSNSMLFTSKNKLKAEFAAELSYVLSKAALNAGESVGLGVISNKLIKSVQPGFGLGMQKRFEMILGDKNNYGGVMNFKKSILQLNSVIGPRSIMIIVSDFLGFEKNWEHYLSFLAIKHDLVGLIIRDQRDRVLPEKSQLVIKDPSSSDTLFIDSSIYASEYKIASRKNEEYVKSVFKKLRGRSLVLENDMDFSKAIESFFRDQRVRS